MLLGKADEGVTRASGDAQIRFNVLYVHCGTFTFYVHTYVCV